MTIEKRFEALQKRQEQILHRLELLEQRLGLPSEAKASSSKHLTCVSSATVCTSQKSSVEKRLTDELLKKGVVNHQFVRAPPEYYDRPLEFRKEVLGATSVHHLCKSIIMENTRIEEGTEGVTKYFLVVVQYSAKLHAEKLRQAVQAIHADKGVKLSKSKVNMRLCDEAVSDRLSGFEHNAVSPVGIKTPLPILMSHKIAELKPDFFWLGGGEVDLKLGMSAKDFIDVYKPFVVDCTYDD